MEPYNCDYCEKPITEGTVEIYKTGEERLCFHGVTFRNGIPQAPCSVSYIIFKGKDATPLQGDVMPFSEFEERVLRETKK